MSIIDKIVVDEMFHIEGVDFALPEDGYRPINEYLNTRYRIVLPPTFDWRWNVENQGSLPKRISAYLHKNHNVDLTQTEKEKIGTIARNKTFTRSSYNFQFGRIDWARGAYGDEESCFFSDRWFARAMLMSNGAMAVKFFNDDGSRFGRAWIALSKYCPDLIFTFNAYPKSFALDQVAPRHQVAHGADARDHQKQHLRAAAGLRRRAVFEQAPEELAFSSRKRAVEFGKVPELGAQAANAVMDRPQLRQQLGDAELRQRACAAKLQDR